MKVFCCQELLNKDKFLTYPLSGWIPECRVRKYGHRIFKKLVPFCWQSQVCAQMIASLDRVNKAICLVYSVHHFTGDILALCTCKRNHESAWWDQGGQVHRVLLKTTGPLANSKTLSLLILISCNSPKVVQKPWPQQTLKHRKPQWIRHGSASLTNYYS